jgi:hypothetical protein
MTDVSVSVDLAVAVGVDVIWLDRLTYGSRSDADELPQAPTPAAAATARTARAIVRVVCVGSTPAKLVLAVTPGYREDP